VPGCAEALLELSLTTTRLAPPASSSASDPFHGVALRSGSRSSPSWISSPAAAVTAKRSTSVAALRAPE
jgi:hypothetical protein